MKFVKDIEYEWFEYEHNRLDGNLTVRDIQSKQLLMFLSMYTAINNDTEVTLYDYTVSLEFIKYFESKLRQLESDKQISSDYIE